MKPLNTFPLPNFFVHRLQSALYKYLLIVYSVFIIRKTTLLVSLRNYQIIVVCATIFNPT